MIIDPFNDFLSEGSKLWRKTKETVIGINLIENLKKILSAARSSCIKVVYVPHHKYEKGDFEDGNSWHLQYGIFKVFPSLKKEEGVENSILNLHLNKEISSLKTIGLLVDLQIQTLIFC